MKRAAIPVIALAALALTSCGGDSGVDDYNEAVAVGPFADWDQEALDSMGESACADIEEGGAGSFAAVIRALESEGLTDDQATRAASAFVVRFCPDEASD